MSDVKITVRDNGPVFVEGNITIVDPTGRAFGLGGRTAVALCRCGHSNNKPFCDGSHKTAGFSSQCVARDLPPPVPKP